MKKVVVVVVFLAGFIINTASRNDIINDDIKVVFENDQIKVTEYDSNPGKDVCGLGEHSHKAHLTVTLTDVKVKITSKDGKTQEAELPAGATFWSEAETHMVINIGNKPAKVLLIEPKDE